MQHIALRSYSCIWYILEFINKVIPKGACFLAQGVVSLKPLTLVGK